MSSLQQSCEQGQLSLQNTLQAKRPPHLQSSQLFPEEINWSEDINKYKSRKENLEWGYNPKPHFITKKEINQQENIFNPITQKYHDKAFDESLRREEQAYLKSKLPVFYDNKLCNEQTFDIVTLEDKLKGFETHPNYPKKAKERVKLNREVGSVPYNILSNYPLSKHHFDAPEKRPTDTLNTEPQRINKVNAVNYKDYDIINCKYKAFDKEKTAIDNQIEQLTAAKKLFISRDYDTIRGIYYDPDKQLQYEKQLQEKKELLLKNFKRAEPYNPVNNIIYDKEFLDNKDKIEEGKKLRYTIKPQLEDYYKMKTYHHDVMKDNAINNKLDYSRYKIQDKRGYDVINWNNTYNNYKNLVACKNKTSAWDELKEKAGENETFSKKQIYKAPYDKSDNDSNKYEFNIHRSAMLKQLPKLEDEETYRRKDFVRKNIQLTEDARKMYKINLSNFDKGNWFKTNRSVEMNEKVPYYNMTKPVKSQIFV